MTTLSPIMMTGGPVDGLTDARRRRSYMYVSFDCEDWIPDLFADQLKRLAGFEYTIFQLEQCPTTGKEHYQGYIQFAEGIRASTINERLPFNVSLRANKFRSPKQAIAYCRKDATRLEGPWEFGVCPAQGTRSDLHQYAEFVIGKTDLRQVVMKDPMTFMRYSRGIQTIMAATAPARTEPPVVVLLFGPPGTGKTRTVYDNFPLDQIFVKQTDDAFFDGYTGQDVFVLDDFAGKASKMSLRYLLCLLDRYPVRLPVKGSTTQLLARKIYITTNVHPKDWYDYGERQGEWECVARRIHQVIWCKSPTQSVALTKSSFFHPDYYRGREDELFVPLFHTTITPNQEDVDMDADL